MLLLEKIELILLNLKHDQFFLSMFMYCLNFSSNRGFKGFKLIGSTQILLEPVNLQQFPYTQKSFLKLNVHLINLN